MSNVEVTPQATVHPPDKMASVRIVKEFMYRGEMKEFSNRYHIGVNFPQTTQAWLELLFNVSQAEAACYPSLALGGAKVTTAFAIGPNSNVPILESPQGIDGTLVPSTWFAAPGDAAAIVRYTTPDRSVKNHPIYLWSYHHAVSTNGVTQGDTLLNQQHSAIQTYHNHWISGFDGGGTLYRRSRPNNGTIGTAAIAETLITHRDLTRP